MTTNTATKLGTIGNRIDLAHTYAPGSYQVDVTFTMDGLTFRAQRFVRTDVADLGTRMDNVDLYICHESSWINDYQGRISGDGANLSPSRVTKRALHLLAVAEAYIPDGTAERFALLEMAA